MNERILELAKKVGAGTPESLYGRTDYIVMTESELNTFANLIIQECINQSVQTKNSKEAIQAQLDFAGKLEMKSENAAIEIAVQRIKQHLGVQK